MNSERITFISNFKSNDIGGGWNGINSYLFNALNELKNVDYLGPINPKVNLFEKAISKSLRMIGLPGRYFFFSEKRLNKIAGSIKNFEKDSLLFFFGVTPWIKYHGTQKYVVYTDICFEDYLNIFLDRTKFKEKDLRRIVLQEKAFLKNATHIFWGSNWAKERSEELLNIKFQNNTILSTGGVIPFINYSPNYSVKFENSQILFISTDFIAKGGKVVFNVVKKLNSLGYNFTLSIVGDPAPKEILASEFVNYHGYLKKAQSSDLAILQNLYSTSFLMIHPTKMDTMGAVIAEAGYYGLPCVAPNNFGIPDLIIDSKTGILVSKEIKEDEIVARVLEIKNDRDKYYKMCKDVQNFMFNNRTWNVIAKKIFKVL